jgi:hypothetical protein
MKMIRRLCVVGVMLVLVGCKAKPAQSVGFADAQLMKADRSVPFQKFWRKPDVEWERYRKVYVADVNTDYMLTLTEWQKGERKKEITKDVRDLGVYTREAIKKAFREDPNHRFEVLDAPTNDSRALVFEMALIEVVPSKVMLNALGYAPFGVGLGLKALRAIGNDKSTVAFEARLRDAGTGNVVMLAADREAEQAAVADLRALTWYSHAQGIVNDWSKQFVRVVAAKPGEKIKDTDGFRLLPW